ncbi:MAG: AbiEi antitoxin N-terminal domain-containing protein [Candidatus Thiodiazotropha sp.]|jgi:predicted transcriptional regulator of viral defense system
MRTSKKQQVLDLAKQKAVIRPADLTAKGLPREYLSRLVDEGRLVRIGRGLYQTPDRETERHVSLLAVTRQVPNGVVALLSALSYHGFTTKHPHEIWIAIDRKARSPKIDYPKVRYLYMSGPALTEGVEQGVIDGEVVKVFNAAKTVADCFKYRNKIGLDVALEALREGWREKRFGMDDLAYYAGVCRVLNVIRPYMESLV